MDLLSLLKQANIFSPTGQMNQQQFPVGSVGGPQSPQDPQQPQGGGLDLNAAIQGMLNPRDEQFNNFAQMIQSMPQQSQYEPGRFRKIAAAIAGMGTGSPVGIADGAVLGFKSNIPEGMIVQQAIEDEPYNKALTQWANKIGQTEKIAQMESTRNVNNRATGIGILQREAADKRIAETNRANLEKESQGREKLQIAQERADAYTKAKQWALDHPKYDKFVDENGELVFVNPTDPTATPIPSGVKKLSEMEKIDLGVKGDLQKIEARGKVSATNTAARQATSLSNAQTLEADRQKNRIELQNLKGTLSKALTPSATRQDRINKAVEIINARPELKGYFLHNTGGNVTGELQDIKDGDPQELEFIREQMGASNVNLPSTSNTVTPNAQPSSTAPSRELTRPQTETPQLQSARKKLESGYVLITRDGGKTFSQIPATNVNKLKPESGWVVVK